MILTGSSLTATQLAGNLPGLEVLPADKVLAAAKDCAKDIAQKSAPVIALAKQAILAGKILVFTVSLYASKANVDQVSS